MWWCNGTLAEGNYKVRTWRHSRHCIFINFWYSTWIYWISRFFVFFDTPYLILHQPILVGDLSRISFEEETIRNCYLNWTKNHTFQFGFHGRILDKLIRDSLMSISNLKLGSQIKTRYQNSLWHTNLNENKWKIEKWLEKELDLINFEKLEWNAFE